MHAPRRDARIATREPPHVRADGAAEAAPPPPAGRQWGWLIADATAGAAADNVGIADDQHSARPPGDAEGEEWRRTTARGLGRAHRPRRPPGYGQQALTSNLREGCDRLSRRVPRADRGAGRQRHRGDRRFNDDQYVGGWKNERWSRAEPPRRAAARRPAVAQPPQTGQPASADDRRERGSRAPRSRSRPAAAATCGRTGRLRGRVAARPEARRGRYAWGTLRMTASGWTAACSGHATSPDGTRYEGSWVKDVKHGLGAASRGAPAGRAGERGRR